MASLIGHDRWAWSKLRAAFAATHMGDPCPYCHSAVLPGQAWDLDHRIPRAYGGNDHPSNLRMAHRRCNRRAGHSIRGQEARPVTHMREW